MTLEELWTLFPIILTAPNPIWRAWFSEQESCIRRLLPAGDISAVHHIGSTAVNGIWAKPIVDILLEVPPGADLQRISDRLRDGGYLLMSRSDNRLSLNLGYTEDGFAEKVFHLHVRREGDRNEVHFRDYLNARPHAAKAYEALKLSLWKPYEHDRDGYTQAKSDFVTRYTCLAMETGAPFTRVSFVRHAQPDLSVRDDRTRPLTEQGLADRSLVTAYFAGRPVDAVYSSPYRRAFDTVLPLAVERGLPVHPIDDFRERSVCDGWIDDFNSFARRQWADFDYRLPNGESLREVQARSLSALHRLLRLHAGQSVVVGAHGTALSALIHHHQPAFSYEAFRRIQNVAPWIVSFIFAGTALLSIEDFNPFSGEASILY